MRYPPIYGNPISSSITIIPLSHYPNDIIPYDHHYPIIYNHTSFNHHYPNHIIPYYPILSHIIPYVLMIIDHHYPIILLYYPILSHIIIWWSLGSCFDCGSPLPGVPGMMQSSRACATAPSWSWRIRKWKVMANVMYYKYVYRYNM